MNLQQEKLLLIEQLIKLQNADLIAKIKALLQEEQEAIVGHKPNGEPITPSELVARAEASERDIASGKTTPLKDFKKEIDQWKKQRTTK